MNRSFEGQPHWLFLPLKKDIIIDNKTTINELALTIVNFDPTAAGQGKTCLTAMLSSNDCDYWVELRTTDKSRYDAGKKLICDKIIDALEEHFGDIKTMWRSAIWQHLQRISAIPAIGKPAHRDGPRVSKPSARTFQRNCLILETFTWQASGLRLAEAYPCA